MNEITPQPPNLMCPQKRSFDSSFQNQESSSSVEQRNLDSSSLVIMQSSLFQLEEEDDHSPIPLSPVATGDASFWEPNTTRHDSRQERLIVSSLQDSLVVFSTPSRVVFEPEVQIKHIVRAGDLVDDPSELWFQHEEYERMKNKIMCIIRALSKDKNYEKRCLLLGRKFNTRGLERCMVKHAHVALRRRREAWNLVLGNQRLLKRAKRKGFQQTKEDQIYYEHLIATSYKECTKDAVSDAIERGASDAFIAETQ